MQSIGERLEEARKRKGISLREAAEATKIRGDFLSNIEQNKFDFELPDIYKNGFIKNYARYLKLDADKILTDYHAQQLSRTRLGRKNGSELFGTMDLKKPASEQTPAELGDRPLLGRIDTKTSPDDEVDEIGPQSSVDDESDKIFYIKAGLIFVGTIVFVIIVFGLIRAILGGGDEGAEQETPELRSPGPAEQATEPANPSVAADELVLEATGDVIVVVKKPNSNERLFQGSLSAGDRVPIEKDGPVEILFTAGENLIIEANGERLRPSATGTAKIPIE